MDVPSIVISLIEILTLLLIYNIIIRDDIFFKIKLKTIIAIITTVFYVLLVKVYNVDQLIILVGVLFLNAIIVSKLEKKDTLLTFIELVVSFLIVTVFELITMFIVHLIMGDTDIEPLTYCILIAITMGILIFLLNKNGLNRKIRLSEFFSKYKSINIIVLNLFVFFLFIKVLLTNELMETNIVIPIAILTLILVGVNCYFYVFLYNILNEKKKNEIKTSFNPLINDLMGKLRANEHEYKNHLNTIWSIVQISKPEEVRDKVKEYIGNLVENNEGFSKLLDVENTIVKAVLYNKAQRAEKLGITYKYRVTSNLKNISLDNSELTVILSNLLNNAIEATSMIKNKEMEVDISEDEKYYIISVINYTENMKNENLYNIFKMGYTTKGEGRGYGLYNIKEIVEKHKGKIKISLENEIINLTIKFLK
ncbi:sensor histidine kinase [Clostridium cuniculi]|uniref:sensor histidine kinase n=1 Tax=Clostridium cuniculi TaxID=2548455 RepID=UPI001055E845|nr:GHKL domain-containing protein [Clostridium cuniculi]